MNKFLLYKRERENHLAKEQITKEQRAGIKEQRKKKRSLSWLCPLAPAIANKVGACPFVIVPVHRNKIPRFERKCQGQNACKCIFCL